MNKEELSSAPQLLQNTVSIFDGDASPAHSTTPRLPRLSTSITPPRSVGPSVRASPTTSLPGDEPHSAAIAPSRQSLAQSLSNVDTQLSAVSSCLTAPRATHTPSHMPSHERTHDRNTVMPTALASQKASASHGVTQGPVHMPPPPASGGARLQPHTPGSASGGDTSERNHEHTSIGELRFKDLPFSLKQSIQETRLVAASVLRLYNQVLFEGAMTKELVSEEYLTNLIETAIEEFSKSAMERRAVEDSRHFTLPPNVPIDDAIDLRDAGSIEELVRRRQALAAEERYNIQRCNAVLADCDPTDFARCQDLAVNGSHVPLPAGFTRQEKPNDMRALAKKLGNTYIKSAAKLHADKRVMIVDIDTLREFDYPGLNWSCDLHWVGNPGKPGGRMLVDPSNPSAGNFALNGPEVKAIGEETYGLLNLPTIGEIVGAILDDAEERGFPVSEYRIYKEDISNAFGCNKIAPGEAAMFATRLSLTLAMLHYYNNFGHTIGPHIFGPLSRCMTEAIQAKINGVIKTYVDDLNGFSHMSFALDDHATMCRIARELLGLKALSDKSYGPLPVGEIIGWYLNLTAGTIRPNDRGIRKLALVFMTIDITTKHTRWPLQLCQVASSLAERYSTGIIAMRPFVEPFHALTRKAAGDTTPDIASSRKVSSLAKMAVIIWRAVIVIMLSDPDRLAVPLTAMSAKHKDRSPTHSVITDAADSVGLGLFDSHGVAMAYTSYKLPFNAHDSRWQNTREFLGIVLALAMFKTHFNLPRGTRIGVKMDSMSALHWLKKNRAVSQYAHVAFLVYTWVCLITGYEIVETTHIAGKSDEMFDFDALSRNKETRGVDLTKVVETSILPDLNEMFSLCDPTQDRTCLNDHMAVFEHVIKCVAKTVGGQH